jgi:hypothetical protein
MRNRYGKNASTDDNYAQKKVGSFRISGVARTEKQVGKDRCVEERKKCTFEPGYNVTNGTEYFLSL